ncbi:hypothetical protein JCM12298_31160 [Desulfothermus naphthae]
MKLTFRISILSDYHIGAGYGKGVIDSVILKDKDGFPIIRGTTIAGLLRQGMWELLQVNLLSQHRKCRQSGALEDFYCRGDDISSLCPICRILGSPKHPKRWKISSAHIENLSILKSGKILWRNRVNPRTRTAEERKLFNEEVFGGKIDFTFTVTNESDDKNALEEAAFIIAAFRMIRNIGASRRRGKGQCQFHLIDISLASLKGDGDIENNMLEIFKLKWLENKEINIPESKEQINKKLKGISTKKCFNLIFLTKEPLLIANKSESGNRFQSIDYIPGYTILGAFAWKAANRCDLTDKTIYEKFIRLFRRGGIKVTPLYPCLRISNDIYPTIPSPLDFLTCKLKPGFNDNNDEHGVKAFAIDKNEPKKCEKCLKEGTESSLEPLNKFVPLQSKPKTVDVEKREEMHIAIDNKTGRTKKGDLFSYMAIESGQYFMGTIEIENWNDFVNLFGIDDLQDGIFFDLRIGKASSRGYGLGRIWLKEADTKNTFLGKPIEERIDLTQPITMTLLTDTILVDKWGRFYSTLNEEILKQILGIEVEVLNAYVKTKLIDGFNAHLGLPKWRDCAIAAGSSIGFKIKESQDNNRIIERFKKLEETGIGLRRNEGFGRVAFNHPVYEKNKGVSGVRVNLPRCMRISKHKEEKIKSFERWWHNYLVKNIKKDAFLRHEWIAIARWLRENSKVSIDDVVGMFKDFHNPKEITEMVKSKQPYREKKMFLDDESKGKKGCDLLIKVFEELSNKLKDEDNSIREYLKTRAIEMLADFIESLREVEK